jgi:hypothetical protein
VWANAGPSRGDQWRLASGGGNERRPSEGELADTLAERHCKEVRSLAAAERVYRQPARKAQWIVSDDEEWLPDTLNLAQRLAREICRKAAETCGDPAVDSSRVVSGVLGLAKSDPRLVASDWPCHPEIEIAVSGRLYDHCDLDPNAWTLRAEPFASFVNREQFDAEDLIAALEAHGVTHRRIRNAHGFDGVKLKDAGGE